VRPTLLYINAGTIKIPANGYKWLSLLLVRNPSERFQTSWNDNHKEKDLRRITLVYFYSEEIYRVEIPNSALSRFLCRYASLNLRSTAFFGLKACLSSHKKGMLDLPASLYIIQASFLLHLYEYYCSLSVTAPVEHTLTHVSQPSHESDW
jgi:hypothetical protein